MGYDIIARRVCDDTVVSDISFGYASPLQKPFFDLMGYVKGSGISKTYTVTELKAIKKASTTAIENDFYRREVKRFLSNCISANEVIDVWFI